MHRLSQHFETQSRHRRCGERAEDPLLPAGLQPVRGLVRQKAELLPGKALAQTKAVQKRHPE